MIYNTFRWYRAGWGRYTQADPVSFLDNPRVPAARRRVGAALLHLYDYAIATPTRVIDPLGLWAIGPPDPNVNTIICDGNGGIVPQIVSKEPCRLACLVAHENSHRGDVLAASPNICQGQPRGMIPSFTSLEEEVDSEGRAYQTSIECLKERLALGNDKNGCCDDELEIAIIGEQEFAKQKGYLP